MERRPWRKERAAVIGAAVIVAADAALALRADAIAPHASPLLTALDLSVGLSFVAAAMGARGPLPQRWLMGAVGVAWLAGSWLPGARSLHQGVLVVALVTFPDGRPLVPRRWSLIRWLPLMLALPVGVGVLLQGGVAAVFGVVAGVSLADRWRGPTARLYPGLAAAGAAVVLGVEWGLAMARPEVFDPGTALLVWQVSLTVIAATFPAATRRVLREHGDLADRMLDATGPGLDGLAAVLGRTLTDPGLRIERWLDSRAAYVDSDGTPVAIGDPPSRWLAVNDGVRPLAVVEHDSAALGDPATAEAVATVVRLTATHLALQEEQREVLAELEASRVRLLAATDHIRQRAAVQLQEEVKAPLAHALGQITAVRDDVGPGIHAAERSTMLAALEVAVRELDVVERDIDALVAGVPPADLGGGQLGMVLRSLAQGSPVPVSIDVADGSSAQTETVLFYVCSEALTNALKHAKASRVVIDVRRTSDGVEARVTDDGCGGADPDGSGLRGLADRVAVCGGRLRVDSPPGAGTVISAIIPER